MDVTLPNGVVITDVPDGTPKHVIAMKAIQKGLATNKDFGYEEAPKTDASFLEGVGAGLVDVGRKATNLLLPDSLTPEFASDEAIARQAEIDKDLEDTTAGFLGKLTGQVAGTLPLGGIGGGLTRAAGLARGASTGAKVLARTLASPVTRGAVEGAAAGAVLSNPDERGAGALMGGAIGAPLGALGQVAGKLGRKFKLVDISDEAKQLQELTGQFIPLSQAAKPGLVKQVYSALLANIPGVGGKLRKQYQVALDDLRRFAGEQAHPPKADIEILPTDSVDDMFRKLSAYWSTAFEDVRKIPVAILKKNEQAPPDFLEELVQKVTRGRLALPQRGVLTNAGHLLDLKRVIEKEILPRESSAVQAEIRKYVEYLDDIIEKSAKGSKFEDAWREYTESLPYFRNWEDLQTAAARATNFTPKQLTSAAKRGKEGLDPEKQTVLQKAGQLGESALENFPSREGLFQSLAATAPVLSTLGGLAGGLGVPASAALYGGVVGVGRGLIRPGFQKFISGQTNLMDEYARALRKLGYTGRQISAILGAEDASRQ